MGKDIDDTRTRIGVEGLDEEQRKKLFRNFIDHGGKVEKSSIDRGTFVRPSPGVPAGKKAPPGTHLPRSRTAAPAESTPKKKRGKNVFASVRIAIRGRFLKVWGVGAKNLNERFVADVKSRIKDAIIDIDLITTSMLHGSSSAAREILSSSAGEHSLLYECIVRLSDIYDEVSWSDFERLVSTRRIPKASAISLMKELFKKLYILGQYRHACTLSILKGIEIQKKHRKITPEDAARLYGGVRSRIDILFDTFLPQLHVLLLRIDGRYLALYSQKLDDFLELGVSDRIGYITRRERKKRAEALKKVKERMREAPSRPVQDEREEIKVPKHVERGLPIIEEALHTFEREHVSESEANDRNFSLLERNDKMYRTLALLEQFDSQYSLVLTTSKIVYNIDFVEQKKVDIKEELNHAYILFNEARTEAMSYLEAVRGTTRAQDDKRLTEYQRSNLLEKLQKKRLMISRNSRNRVAAVMKRTEEVLSTVITDYSSDKRLLQNPEERLRFDPNIDGFKKLESKRTIEAIVETFLYASTFAFLLRYGQLSGGGMFIEKEEQADEEQ
ncbi:MAG: hypothetical protein JXQ30_01460 [Spirochaetes bacterium]|nr:hypothetical protein [Spirochaetota bacterium]